MTDLNSVSTPADGAGRQNIEAILPLLPNQRALLLYREIRAGDDPGFLQVFLPPRFTPRQNVELGNFLFQGSK